MLAALLSAGLLSATPHNMVCVFQIESNGASISQKTVNKTAIVMRRRLAAALLRGTVKLMPHDRLEAIVDAGPPAFAVRILSAPGHIKFRVTPSGDTYNSPAPNAIKTAFAESDQAGNPMVEFKMADPVSFYRFTRTHLHKRLGIFLDGKLLSAPEVMGPISDEGEIVGNFSFSEVRYLAAVISSGPLPSRVKLLFTSEVTAV